CFIAKPRGVVEPSLDAQVIRVGGILDDLLGRDDQTLLERQGFCRAFLQHGRRFLGLIEVGSHRGDTAGVEIREFPEVHSSPLQSTTLIASPTSGYRRLYR